MTLVQDILQGNRLALARLLTQIENNSPEGRQGLDKLFAYSGKAHLIGVTGAPGTGKSSLVNQLAYLYRHSTERETKRVGVVAVDPSSPFTGGAILGDRVRMRDLAGDPGIFIRSMASRGSLGGLAAATSGVVQALDAAGFEIILIETVGAGQAEVDIARLAHTTIVVEAPGFGDEIQAIKAGILEIADVLVINKADHPGVETTERALRSMLQLAHPSPHVFQDRYSKSGHHKEWLLDQEQKAPLNAIETKNSIWIPAILRSIATEGVGISEIVLEIDRHWSFLHQTGGYQRREHSRFMAELDLLIRETLLSEWRDQVSDAHYEEIVELLMQRKISPRKAVESLLKIDKEELP